MVVPEYDASMVGVKCGRAGLSAVIDLEVCEIRRRDIPGDDVGSASDKNIQPAPKPCEFPHFPRPAIPGCQPNSIKIQRGLSGIRRTTCMPRERSRGDAGGAH